MWFLSNLFILVAGLVAAFLVYLYLYDRFQKKSTLRRNFPVIARGRYFLENMGVFLRQYFYSHDREEMPFNRAERSWAYRAAKDVSSTVAFGSTRDLNPAGTVFFSNSAYPTMEEDIKPMEPVIIGEYSRRPYSTASIFNISGMSYGAISKPAVQALSYGAKKAGIWLNTGEGGLAPFHIEGGCDIVFQIGTAKFGVKDEETGGFSKKKLKELGELEQVKMIEIKLSQGAKPGKGGILPGVKVDEEIAAIRGINVGEPAISPNRHPEINNTSELMDVVSMIREESGLPTGFKAVIGEFVWVEEICEEIKKRGIEHAPDFITIDSADGGTGAAPMALMDNVGIPLKEALPRTVDILEKHGLRDRIKIVVSGKMVNPTEVAWAFCAGADFVNSARGFMFALGCIQAMQCNRNTCPTGITTNNKNLQYGLNPENKTNRVYNFAKNMEKEVNIIAHSCGVNDARGLNRHHARIVLPSGKSLRMDELYFGKEDVQVKMGTKKKVA